MSVIDRQRVAAVRKRDLIVCLIGGLLISAFMIASMTYQMEPWP
jgi:hypothetical protein